eukprot:4192700-Lingulodinium_polyedra.AAC.1
MDWLASARASLCSRWPIRKAFGLADLKAWVSIGRFKPMLNNPMECRAGWGATQTTGVEPS